MYTITITQKQFDELNKALSAIFEVEYVHIDAGETHFEKCKNYLNPNSLSVQI